MGIKKQNGGEYYSLTDILKYNATYNFIIGMRSNGKTFACLEYILDDFLKTGRAGAIIRRYELEIRGDKGKEMYSGFVHNAKGNFIAQKTKGEYNDFIYQSRQFTLCYRNEKGEIERNGKESKR